MKNIRSLDQYSPFFFFLGCMPNITRNAIVNCAELVTYDMIKELILKYDLMTGKQRTQTTALQITIYK